jgi:hypothetical protein
MAFNTAIGTSADPDLHDDFALGNLAGATDLLNALIISENDAGGQPDDEGNQPAGTITVDLDFQASSLGFDILDIDSTTVETGGVDFFLDSTLVGSFEWSDLVGGGALADPSVVFGDNSANRINPVALADLVGADGDVFDLIVFRMGGSGAVDNLEIEEAPVPEPAALSLLLLGAAALLGTRRVRG